MTLIKTNKKFVFLFVLHYIYIYISLFKQCFEIKREREKNVISQ